MTGQTTVRSRWTVPWPALGIVALLVTGWLVYEPALSGTFLLDDHANLSDLRIVDDASSALHFVLTGTAGPLGRPLALASFVPQAPSWGVDATPFLRVNILIHLVNGLLLLLFSRQLGRILLPGHGDVLLLAFATTAVWLFMPLLASSSLLIVQRMTTLSATFALLGLNAYMAARARIDTNPRSALAGMSIALPLFTLLAVLAKENGALLPAFALAAEAALLPAPRSLPTIRWKIWCGVFLISPTLVIVAFLLAQIPYPDELVALREFTAGDRLLSEARILWEYLFNAFVAPAAELGPFHESRGVNEPFFGPLTIAAVVAWAVIVAAGLRWRRRYPVAVFGVFWFLAGHLLESTTVPLELYFEHRNYLPIIGPVFALCYFVLQVPRRYRVVARASLAAYTVLNAVILLGVTTMWGRPLLAASLWHAQDPTSVRAATTLASRQLTQMGPEAAVSTLRKFATEAPRYAYIRIPELNLLCMMAPGQDHADLVRYLDDRLPSVAFSLTTGEMLDQLLTTAVNGQCESVSPTTVADLATAVVENPRYAGSISYNQFHQMLLARIARASGDTEATLRHLARAIELQPSDDLNMMTVTTLVEAGRYEQARDFIKEADHTLSHHPLRRFNSEKYLDELLAYVNESEKLATGGHAADTGD